MIYHLDRSTNPTPEHAEAFGKYNDAPPGWREVTEAQVATESMWRIYTPTKLEYRQIRQENGPYLDVQMMWAHDNTGTAIHFDWSNKKVRWFMFGCQHQYVEISRPANNRSGLHTDKCSKCGYVHTYDTSD